MHFLLSVSKELVCHYQILLNIFHFVFQMMLKLHLLDMLPVSLHYMSQKTSILTS